MENTAIDKILMQIFKDIFETEDLRSKDQFCQANIADWDSIGHVRLITAIENEFGREIPYEEAVTFDSFEKISAFFAHAKI